jgi:hypothetical protein
MTPTHSHPAPAPALIAGESHARAALLRGDFEAAVRSLWTANNGITYGHARAIAFALERVTYRDDQYAPQLIGQEALCE